jgi:hypothetical protein
MNYIQSAIKLLSDPKEQNKSAQDFALKTLKRYYAENLKAHQEYLQKDIYTLIPLMTTFKQEMEQIEEILNKQLTLF